MIMQFNTISLPKKIIFGILLILFIQTLIPSQNAGIWCNAQATCANFESCDPSCTSNCCQCDATNKAQCKYCNGADYLENSLCVTTCTQAGNFKVTHTILNTNTNTNVCYQICGCDQSCCGCTGPANNECIGCNSNTYLTASKTCVATCGSQFYQDSSSTQSCGNKCTQCNSPCLDCSSATVCTSCPTTGTVFLQDNTCVASCTQGFFQSNPTTCTKCDSSCCACVTTATTCTGCATGGVLQSSTSNTCLSTTTNPNPCQSNQIQMAASTCGQVCLDCTPPCTKCSTSQTFCTACSTSTDVIQGGTCQIKCNTGFYANAQQICTQCTQANCNSCANGTTNGCIACNTQFYLSQGTCSSTCTQIGQFADNTQSSFQPGGVCSQCDISTTSNCLSCQTSATTCTSCQPSYYLYNNKCVQDCTATNTQQINLIGLLKLSQQLNNGSQILIDQCVQCSSSCCTCQSTTTACTACNSGQNPLLLPGDFQCLPNCPPNYYQAPGTNLPSSCQQQICKQCPYSTCATCNSTACLTCLNSNLLATNGTCNSNCPPGEFQLNAQNCSACATDCCTCTGSLKTNCLTCNAGLYLNSTTDNCTNTQCPQGYYQSQQTSTCNNANYFVCLPCNPICCKCTGPQTTDCQSCQGTGYLQTVGTSTSCVTQCNLEFYKTVQTSQTCGNECTACPTGCCACELNQSTNIVICLSCNANNYLQSSNQLCVPNCQTGFYQQAITTPGTQTTCPQGNQCMSCQPCCSCQQQGVCTGCDGTTYLNTNTHTCVPTCPTGFFSEITSGACGNVCTACTPAANCYTCDKQGTNCTACSSNFFLKVNQCLNDCGNNFYQLSATNNNTCQPCDQTCCTCSGPGSSQCLTCNPNLYLQSSSIQSCIPTCLTGTYPSVSPSLTCGATCLSCDQSCCSCSGGTATDCTGCDNNKYLTNNQCLTNCAFQFYGGTNSTAQVSTCALQCMPCTSPCNTCNQVSTNCTSCITQRSLNISGNAWSCVVNCPGSQYSQQTSLNVANFSNTVSLQNQFQCASCDQSCLTCFGANDQSCITCKTGTFFLNLNNSCMNSCPGLYYQQTIGSQGYCLNCNTACLNCNGPSSSNCTSCNAGTSLQSGVCVSQCNQTNFLNTSSNECQSCTSPCCSCETSSIQCTGCISGYYLQQNKMCTLQVQQPCPVGQYPVSQTCNNSQYFVCTNCLPDCCACTGPTLNDCTLCKGNAYLYTNTSNNNQVQCVTNCPIQYYQTNNGSPNQTCGNICVGCAINCCSCNNNQPTECLSCLSGFFLQLVSSTSSNGQCVQNCATPYYNNPNPIAGTSTTCSTTQTCLPCDTQQCCSCTESPTKCTGCSGTNFLNKANFQCQNTNIQGFYQNPGTGCGNTYEPCNNTCYQCNGGAATQCTQCAGSLYLVQSNNTCDSNCPTGFYPLTQTNNNTCQPCPQPNCCTCTSNLTTGCQSCKSTYYLNQNNFECMSQCFLGFFNDNSNPSVCQGGKCTGCPQNCTSCSSSTTCTSCNPTYSLLNGACVSKCNSDQFSAIQNITTANGTLTATFSTAVCQPCDTSCCTCNGPNATNCLSCNLNSWLNSNNSCVANCPSGTFQNNNSTTCSATNNLCSACDSSCKTCSGPSNNNCLSCYGGTVLNINVCANNCSFNQYLPAQSQNCTNCTAPCCGCTGPNNGDCTSCQPNFYLSSGSCLSTNCPQAFYASSVSSQCTSTTTGNYFSCLPCNPSCCVCTGPSLSQCSQCQNQGYLFTNTSVNPATTQCVLDCPLSFIPQTIANNVCGNTCQACYQSCCTCTDTTQTGCLTCKTNFYLFNNNQCIANCSANPGFFNKIVSSSIPGCTNNVCEPCLTPCCSCSQSATNCTGCTNGLFLNATGFTCISNCGQYAGFYDQVGSTNQQCSNVCGQCDSSCCTCMGSSSNCQSCTNNTYLQGSTCQPTCNNGFYKVGNNTCNNTCQACPVSNCYDCTSMTNGSVCSSCNSGFYLLSNNCITSCTQGFYNVPGASANQGGTCAMCDNSCCSCIGAGPTNCTGCNQTTYLSGNTCVTQCQITYYGGVNTQLNQCQNQCLQCLAPCQTCNITSQNCTSCNGNNYLQNISFSFSCIAQCGTNQYNRTQEILIANFSSSISIFQSKCLDCSTTCCTCHGALNTNCDSCPSGTYLNTQTFSCATTCPNGTFQQNQTGSCPGVCAQCDPSCQTCNGSTSTNCLSCYPGSVFSVNKCTSNCSYNQYLILGTNNCSSCPAESCGCINATNFLQCSQNYNYFNSTQQCLPNCPAGYYSGPKINNNCTPQETYQICQACPQDCCTCTGPALTDCTSCQNSLFLYQNSSNSNSLQCMQNCPVTFYKVITNQNQCGQTCSSCAENCCTCQSALPTQCTSCISGFYLYSQTCISNCSSITGLQIGLYNLANPTGTVSGCTANICQQCNSNCFTCLNTATNCTSCTGNLFLNATGNVCLSNCSITNGFYNEQQGNKCGTCETYCCSCQGSATNCQNCTNNYYLQGSTCQQTCNNGYFPVGNNTCNNFCAQCPQTNCYNCQPAGTTCLACMPNYYLLNNNCALQCQNGYYNNNSTSTATQGGVCSQCDPSCCSCTGPTSSQCTGCSTLQSNNLFLNQNKCIQICPFGQYSAVSQQQCGNQCMPCDTNSCLSCSMSSTNCTSCLNNSVFLQKSNNQYSCVSSCSSTEFSQLSTLIIANATSNVTQFQQQCLECNPSCCSCSVNANRCNSCPTGNYLNTQTFTCGTTCPNGTFYFNGTGTCSNICQECDPSCKTCNGSTPQSCTSCYPGFLYSTSQNICSNQCGPNEYQLTNSSQCLECAPQCCGCITPNNSSCKQCALGFYFQNNSCLASCNPGFYPGSLQNNSCNPQQEYSVCQACNQNCCTCSGPNLTNCNSCQNQGYLFTNLTSNSQQCLIQSCPTGFFAQNIPNQSCGNICSPCAQNCCQCTSSSPQACTACAPGFYLYENTQCVSNCSSFTGFYNNNQTSTVSGCTNNTCQKCTAPCCNCVNSPTNCTGCSNNYFLNSTGNVCVENCSAYNGFYNLQAANNMQCGNTCGNCETYCCSCMGSSTNCSSCTNNYYLQGMMCQQTCNPGFYPVGNNTCNNTCQQCPVAQCCNCTTQPNGSVCSSCNSQYYLLNNTCLSVCTDGFYPVSPTNPLQCGGTCQACNESCCSCTSASSSACSGCSNNTYLSNSQCVAVCPFGQYGGQNQNKATCSNQCLNCQTPCQTCNMSSTNCTSCIHSYYLYINQTQQMCLQTCYNSTYAAILNITVANGTGTVALPFQQQCLNCDPSCCSCSGGQPNQCLTCPQNNYFVQQNNSCSANCPNGTFQFNGQNQCSNVCEKCDPTCQTCSGAGAFNCTACFGGRLLSNGQCLNNCSANQYLPDSTTVCQNCSSTCCGCQTNASNCIQCAANLNLFNNTCLPACPQGYYSGQAQNNSCISSAQFFQCLQCDSNCCECTGPSLSNCTRCQNNGYLFTNSTNNSTQCVLNCPTGFFQLPNTTASGPVCGNICQACAENCCSCLNSSATACQQCVPNFYLYKANSSCISQCPIKYFAQNIVSNVATCTNNVCTDCDSSCCSCIGTSSNCTGCSNNLYLNQNNQCVANCSTGYYNDNFTNSASTCGNTCSSCNTTACCTCFGPSTTQCNSCTNNYYLLNTTCFQNCIQGYFAQGTNSCDNQCIKCNQTNCCACNNSTSTGCTDCVAGFYNLNGTCYQDCPTGYYNNMLSTQCGQGTCLACSQNCCSCNGPNATQCTGCSNNTYLSGNQCLQNCPFTYYQGMNVSSTTCNNLCLFCTTPCHSCSLSASNCTSCQQGFLLLNYQCVTNCTTSTFATIQTLTFVNGASSTNITLIQHSCLNCSAPCCSCEGAATRCLSCQQPSYFYSLNNTCGQNCPNGYYMVNGSSNTCSNTCNECVGCKTCQTSATNCTSCAGTLLLSNTTNTCVNSCNITEYLINTNGTNCTSCPTQCCTCFGGQNGNCSDCAAGYFFDSVNNFCNQTGCPAGFYPNQTTSKCNTTYNTCLKCNDLCCICTGPASTQCQSCASGAFLSNTSCVQNCPSSTFEQPASGSNTCGGICQKCSANCCGCSGAGASQCTACVSGYYYLSQNSSCVQTCPSGQFQNAIQSNTQCTNNICDNCNQNCCECSNTATNCTSCNGQLYLQGNQCVSQCNSGQFQQPASNNGQCGNICQGCDPSCCTCSGGSNTQCLTCGVDSNNNNQSVYLLNNQCLATCPVGYYAQNSTNNQQCGNNCQLCHETCCSCTGPDSTQCTGCSNSYYFNPKTTSCLTSSAIPAQFYGITNSSLANCQNVLAQCDSSCYNCSGNATFCTSCNQQSYLQLNNTCVNQCNSNQYVLAVAQNSSCQNCDPACCTCKGPSNQNCTACANGQFYYQNQCYQKCANSLFQNSVSETGCNNTCIKCPSVCLACTGEANCSGCITGYFLSQNNTCLQCSSQCQTCQGQANFCQTCTQSNLAPNSQGQCVGCQPPCQNCFYSPTSCTSCVTGYYYQLQQCLPCPTGCVSCSSPQICSGCNPGYYQFENSCQKCSSNCNTCQFSSTQCLTCNNNQVINSQNQCVTCSANCTQCQGPNPNQCSACIDNFFLQNNTCIQSQLAQNISQLVNVQINYTNSSQVQQITQQVSNLSQQGVVTQQDLQVGLNIISQVLNQQAANNQAVLTNVIKFVQQVTNFPSLATQQTALQAANAAAQSITLSNQQQQADLEQQAYSIYQTSKQIYGQKIITQIQNGQSQTITIQQQSVTFQSIIAGVNQPDGFTSSTESNTISMPKSTIQQLQQINPNVYLEFSSQTNSSNPHQLQSSTVLLGDICGARVFQGSGFTPINATNMQFQIQCQTTTTTPGIVAVYFDENTQQWSSQGLSYANGTITTPHLTEFSTSIPSLIQGYQTTSTSSSSHLALGLGIGLGVGIPCLLLLIILICVAVRRSKSSGSNNEKEMKIQNTKKTSQLDKSQDDESQNKSQNDTLDNLKL